MMTTRIFKFNSSSTDMAESKEQNNNRFAIIHLWWVIGVLSVVIIGLLAIQCTQIVSIDKRIMTFLSFAATILSIVLSIFAIMYSYYSLQESSRQWSDIKKAVSTIDTSTQMISQSTQLLLGQVTNMNKDIGALQSKIANEIPDPTTDGKKIDVDNLLKASDKSHRTVRRTFSSKMDD